MQAIVSLTSELIRFRSMHSEPAEIQRCADFVAAWLEQAGLACRRHRIEGVPSISVLPAGGHARVLLMSHIDVVDGAAHLFHPREEQGRLYGRGALDDKYAVALSMVLARDWLRKLRGGGKGQDDMPFGLLITGDEEVGGQHGARSVLRELGCDFCIALDGGDPGRIVVKEKGILRLKLSAAGRAAHGARPWLGENAIELLLEDIRAIRRFFRYRPPAYWHRTLNIGTISGGRSINQVPDSAEAIFDIRFTERDAPLELVERMRRRIRGRLEVLKHEGLFRGGASPYLELLRRAAPQAVLGSAHGASDARHLSEFGMRGVVWGAEGGLSFHSDAEHVDIDSLGQLYHQLDAFLAAVAGKGFDTRLQSR
jgi:succinyl-diaminopimelate desuccinylase